MVGGQCSSAHTPRIPIDMSHTHTKKINQSTTGNPAWWEVRAGLHRWWKKPSWHAAIRAGSEGRAGGSPSISKRVYYQHCRTSQEARPCEENKKLRLWTKRGAIAVRDMRGSGSRWRPGILSALLPLQGATLRMCAQEVFNWMKG